MSIFSDAWMWLLIIVTVVAGGTLFWLWRKRRLDLVWQRLPASDYRQYEQHEPGFDDNTPMDEVIEDEFWMPTEAPDVLGDHESQQAAQAEAKEPPRELIVALFVCALRGNTFHGSDVFPALENLGLSFGAMDIYHHYGLDERPTKPPANVKPVFSVANMTEPGTLVPTYIDEFKSSGLVFFMRLPGPLGGRVAFEYMLNHAQRLAEFLKGNLEDEHRQTLNAESISHLREGIEAFEAARR